MPSRLLECRQIAQRCSLLFAMTFCVRTCGAGRGGRYNQMHKGDGTGKRAGTGTSATASAAVTASSTDDSGRVKKLHEQVVSLFDRLAEQKAAADDAKVSRRGGRPATRCAPTGRPVPLVPSPAQVRGGHRGAGEGVGRQGPPGAAPSLPEGSHRGGVSIPRPAHGPRCGEGDGHRPTSCSSALRSSLLSSTPPIQPRVAPSPFARPLPG